MKYIYKSFLLMCVSSIILSCFPVFVFAEGELVPYQPGWLAPTTPTGEAINYASSGGNTISIVGLGEVINHLWDFAQQTGEVAVGHIYEIFNDDVCPENLNNHKHSFQKMHTQVDGVVGNYYICEYCGKSAGEVLDTAYTDYTSTLPATDIDSNGCLYIYANHDKVYKSDGNSSNVQWGCSHAGEFENDTNNPNSFIEYVDDDTRHVILYSLSLSVSPARLYFCYNFIAPINGYYTVINGVCASGFYRKYGPSGLLGSYNISLDFSSTLANTLYYSGNNVKFSKYLYIGGGNTNNGSANVYYDLYYFIPVIKITPIDNSIDTDITSTGTTYNTNTRAASITGDYGIIGENNQLTKIDQQTIVNEGASTVYNPVTNETHNIENWTYDYTTRSYDITYLSTDESTGDTTTNSMTVTYGDENITINEGDNTYNVYYIIDQSDDSGNGGGTDTPDTPHHHNYTSAVTREASCLATGIRTFTCSCGDSYTEAIPAMGHDWVIDTQVLTEYDDSGEIITQGFTIYKCSRCGEEYRSDDSSSPVAASDGTLTTWNQRLLQFFSQFPDMWGDLTSFLHEGFGYLPEEVLTLLEFSVLIAVMVALVKALRG